MPRTGMALAAIIFISFLMPITSTCRLIDLSSTISQSSLSAARSAASEVSSASLEGYLGIFSEARGFLDDLQALWDCRDAIVSTCKAMGYAAADISLDPVNVPSISWRSGGMYDWHTSYGPFLGDNIIVTKRGLNPSLRPIVVAAHYDTVPYSPGTNDNGSGCSAVLECARILKDKNLDRTVLFVFFCFEESGLQGSQQFLAARSGDQLPWLAYVFETIGFTSPAELSIPLLPMPSSGNFLAVIASPNDRSQVADFLKINGLLYQGLPVLGINIDANASSNPITSNLLRSDHISFWNRGISAFCITDTANFREGNHYHQDSDTIDTIDLAFLTKVVQCSLANILVKSSA